MLFCRFLNFKANACNLLLPVLTLLFLGTACSNASSDKAGTGTIVQEKHCFLKEYPFSDGSDNKDVVSLNIEVKGNKISGTYDWLPAMKDQRKGTIEGLLVGNLIEGQYIYMQEGQTDTVAINIALVGNQAQIKGENPEQDLTEILEKVACK